MHILDLLTFFLPIDINQLQKTISFTTEKTIVKEINKKEKEKINLILNSNISKKTDTLIGQKDNLFEYKGIILKSEYNNDIVTYEYNIKRDIEDRDIIDVDRADDLYVDIIDVDNRQEQTLNTPYGKQLYWETKDKNIKDNDVKIVILYFHGAGGNRHQGINDYTFGGNFNRIQNLMLKNNGVYISNDFTNFDNIGTIEMSILIQRLNKQYPNSKIILSGASSGGSLLWNILKNKKIKEIIDGIILMGSVVDNKTDIYNYNIPIYISHGTRDPILNYQSKYSFYKYIKNNNFGYPIKIEFFNNGIHGTPIRMTNWKNVLSWIIKNNN